MKKPPHKRAQNINISIGVACIPRNDALAADIIHKMAIAAAELLPARQRRETLNYVADWLRANAAREQ
jgi:hypothetical protein